MQQKSELNPQELLFEDKSKISINLDAQANGNLKLNQALKQFKQKEAISETIKKIEMCIYCQSKDVVKRGIRKKKLEAIQLYKCNICKKTFTGQKVKGKTFPLKIILEWNKPV